MIFMCFLSGAIAAGIADAVFHMNPEMQVACGLIAYSTIIVLGNLPQ